jgi:hypothetical protein
MVLTFDCVRLVTTQSEQWPIVVSDIAHQSLRPQTWATVYVVNTV